MDYSDFSKNPRSKKITLAIMKAKQVLKSFEFVSGDTWKRKVTYFVSNVTGAPFEYDPFTSTLYVTTAVDPKELNLIIEYSFFFSDFPINQDVEFQARLQDIGALKLELDSENTGVAVESDSSVKLENTDGYFDEIFDRLIWENQECEFFSWSPAIPWSERRLIYRGYINTKTFSTTSVSFTLKDSFVKLREKLPSVSPRMIYGKVNSLDCSGTNKIGEGFHLTGLVSGRNDRDALAGVISGVATANTITGTGTLFLTQIQAGDKIRVVDGIIEYNYTVNSITNNTSLVISGTISVSFSGAQGKNASKLNNIIEGSGFLSELSPEDEITISGEKYKVKSVESNTMILIEEQIKIAFTNVPAVCRPAVNYRIFNRTWCLSGHKLASVQTTIESVISQSIFTVSNPSHIQKDDVIEINGHFYQADRVSGKMIFLNQAAVSLISTGDEVNKPSVQKLIFDGVEFVHGRDFTEINNSLGCVVHLDNKAEFNVATEKITGVSLSFVNGSREVVTVTNTLDLTTILKPRDWIKGYTGTVDYYEILAVEPTKLYLRTPYAESNFLGPALYRTPSFAGDDSLILADCMGKENEDGTWLKTAAHAVKDICQILGLQNLNNESFEKSSLDRDYTISLAYPKTIGDDMPIARDAILEINKAVMGSLYSDSNFNLSYSILTPDRDIEEEVVSDSDQLSFSIQTKNQIVGKVITSYRYQPGIKESLSYEFENNNLPGIKNELSLALPLFDELAAINMTQRYAFFRSQSQTTVTIKGKLNFIGKSLNDKVYLSLRRLFKRYGSNGSIKVGVINSITKDSNGVEIQVNDLGNVFSRVGAIAPNVITDYDSSSDKERAKYGYIVDSDTKSVDPDDDSTIGGNLIG